MKIYCARIILPLSGPPFEGGAVAVEGSQIVAVGALDDMPAGERVDLGDVVLLPGLINAHCHLDYTVMRGSILPQHSFTNWIRRINDLKRTLNDDDYLESIRLGFEELQRWGTTSVFNLESFPELMVRMPRPPIRTWWFYEMLDIRNRLQTEDVVAGALSFFEEKPGWLGGFGLSPHAPYTASAGLYEMTRFCCEKYSMPWTTHLAETAEEFEMFVKGSGPLYEFLYSLGRNMSDTGGITPFARLMDLGVVSPGGLLVHLNCLAESDFPLLEKCDVHVVHCPGCHEYFGRPPFELERLRALGIPISLGTDSLASNFSLNLFKEMQILRRNHPSVSHQEALEMVTLRPARAIGQGGRLGEITPTAFADLIAIPCLGGASNAVEAVVENQAPIPWIMVDGNVVLDF